MKKATGGSAFPAEYYYDQETGYERMPAVGMTLRDYFAAKAMQGFLELDMQDEYFASEIAKESYKQADAMLEARNK